MWIHSLCVSVWISVDLAQLSYWAQWSAAWETCRKATTTTKLWQLLITFISRRHEECKAPQCDVTWWMAKRKWAALLVLLFFFFVFSWLTWGIYVHICTDIRPENGGGNCVDMRCEAMKTNVDALLGLIKQLSSKVWLIERNELMKPQEQSENWFTSSSSDIKGKIKL